MPWREKEIMGGASFSVVETLVFIGRKVVEKIN
jgi:hypothetical protein